MHAVRQITFSHTDGSEAGKKWKTRLSLRPFALFSLPSPHLSSSHSLTCHAFPPTSSSPDHRQLFSLFPFPLLVASWSSRVPGTRLGPRVSRLSATLTIAVHAVKKCDCNEETHSFGRTRGRVVAGEKGRQSRDRRKGSTSCLRNDEKESLFSRSKLFIMVHSLQVISCSPLALGGGSRAAGERDVRTFIRRHGVTRVRKREVFRE